MELQLKVKWIFVFQDSKISKMLGWMNVSQLIFGFYCIVFLTRSVYSFQTVLKSSRRDP